VQNGHQQIRGSVAVLGLPVGFRSRQKNQAAAKERGKAVLHITHSIDEAITLSDRVLVFGPRVMWSPICAWISAPAAARASRFATRFSTPSSHPLMALWRPVEFA